MSRRIDPKIWQCPPHTFERQPGKKKDTDDYQFISCILGQKAGLLTRKEAVRDLKVMWGPNFHKSAIFVGVIVGFLNVFTIRLVASA
jgi:hypothetical protein